ncbi:aminodeoxychorismate synthase component I [Rhodoferax sp. GW822-FHT02A01]|uniref:aminodeoxychorismate synthase component I n=1 Tax=Rhodoferax sp. GW822-FHT02A01 TaxID=3141537 RepID=UPI00315D1F3D
MDDVFVLLDDCDATAQSPTSRLYSGFVHERRCTDAQSLDAFWQLVQTDQQAGLHAALFIDYEWGSKLQQAGLAALAQDDASALRVFLFRSLQHLCADAVSQWLAQREGCDAPGAAGVCDLQSSVTPERFASDIARIRDLISRGETYQVNYTLRMQGSQYGSPVALYRRLRSMQPVAFGALACLPGSKDGGTDQDAQWVISASPELFLRHHVGQLTARPMKGTAARLQDVEADQQQARWLQHDTKNRAENVMIVDLLRNDLGRISSIGSVRVPHLFSIETYTTVHQMTSTVTSTLRDGVGFAEVLRALFPCGSITGAPKLHTMDLIADLESSPRGLYCGAIGWIDAPKAHAAMGDFCLSVAIRTLTLGAAQAGRRPVTLGVGSGVVLDSDAHTEYAETQAKARFLTAMDPGFTLFETMRVSHGRIHHLNHHRRRLQGSAEALGFRMDEQDMDEVLQQKLATLEPTQQYRMRLDLCHDGSMTVQHAALPPLALGPARLVLSDTLLPPHETALLMHKTSLRSGYDAAIRKAVALDAFDTIFVNALGELSEGARSNLLIQSNGRWYTPPLASGVLRGVMRTRLLERCPHITEKVLHLQDALSAQALMVCSALRGLQRAQWVRDATGDVQRV